ncbi:MAG: tRNA-dihydrouridine synthase [Bdellovibrionales bacterium]|nr:tRNA-dihydrouridine synthase [Bdellovibrionales bacterium]
MMPGDNPFILAPMAGITDMPFRRLMKRMGAGTVISEFVSAHAVLHQSPRTRRYLAYHPEERPVGIQLFGGDEDVLAEAAKITQDTGVDFIDINLGCPVPKVTKKGGGSAWLCRQNEMGVMFRKVKSAITVPLTIKIRTGWDENTKNAAEILRIAREEGVASVAIHGRTRTQGYAGHADWSFIRNLNSEKIIPLIGNGDIISGPLAAARLHESGCAGVMIGRGALKNPWIFREAMEAWEAMQKLPDDEARTELANSVIAHHRLPPAGEVPDGKNYYQRKVKRLQPLPVSFTADYIRIRADRDASALIKLHLELLREAYPEERVKLAFRKFLAWYAAGYPGASQFRKFIFTHDDFSVIESSALEFFDSVKQLGAKGDEARDELPVLMSGHG